jgi:hypothetical protein
LVLILVFIVACSNAAKTTETQNQGIISQKSVAAETAIIATTNQPSPNCVNECNADGCVNNDFFECRKNESGCNYQIKIGPVLGKCDVGCLNDNNCGLRGWCKKNETKFRVVFYCINRTNQD